MLGKPSDAGRELNGGPQMLQLSLDGRRLYVSNSLYSTWDNQFYPGCARGCCVSTATPTAAWRSTRDFFVDFHDRPDGPARAHEVRLQGRRLHDGDLPVIAHVSGLPVEETLSFFGPALLLASGVALTWLHARLRSVRRWSRTTAREGAGR